MALWKNLVFFSPSYNHRNQYLCFQRISSCFFLSSILFISSPSSQTRSSNLPSWIIFYWNSTIHSLNSFWSLIMCLNYSLFHFLIFFFSSFKFNWKVWTLFLPCCSLHVNHSFIFLRILGSLNKKDSNLKGWFLGIAFRSTSKRTG